METHPTYLPTQPTCPLNLPAHSTSLPTQPTTPPNLPPPHGQVRHLRTSSFDPLGFDRFGGGGADEEEADEEEAGCVHTRGPRRTARVRRRD
jgi:hypothetical protein